MSKNQGLKALQVRRSASHRLIERLLAEHAVALRLFIRVRLGPAYEHDLEDVLQDVYVRLSQIEDLTQRLAGRLDTARNYLLQIASNLLIDRARRAQTRQRSQHVSDHELEHPPSSDTLAPERTLANKRKLQRIEKELNKIKPAQRQAFMLSRVDGMSYREISDTLGLSVSTVEKHIAAALKAAQKALAKEEQYDL
jgi:RNA polymerase sigma-70 factor (ECF subfamily)